MLVTVLLAWVGQAAALRVLHPFVDEVVDEIMAKKDDGPPSKVQTTSFALMTKALGGAPMAPPQRQLATATPGAASASGAGGAAAGAAASSMSALAADAVAAALAVAKQKAEGAQGAEEDFPPMDDTAAEPPWGQLAVNATAHPAGSMAAILASITGGKGGAGKGAGRATSGYEARSRRLILQM